METNGWWSQIRDRLRRFFWHGFWSDPVVFFSIVPAVIVNIALWVALFITIEPTDRDIILHYNIYFGVDAIGSWKNVFFMPGLALALLLINLVLSRFFYYKERLLAYLFSASALILQLLMVIGIISVIIINF
ncbi:MAG: hypothetical protein WC858_01385 [Parcubacteria group bacterium]|jgi:hypothetical protein